MEALAKDFKILANNFEAGKYDFETVTADGIETLTSDLKAITRGRWEWQSNSNPWDKREAPQWKSYSLEHNYLIEKAYYDKKDEIDIGSYVVSIKHMIQKQKNYIMKQRCIRRVNWIDSVYEKDRSDRYLDTELPKTINKIFGSLGDFLAFFSKRNPEILAFATHFKELEQSNDLNILNQKILPKLVDCFEEVLLEPSDKKVKNSSGLSKVQQKLLLKMKEQIEEIIMRFKAEFLSTEEFYGYVFKVYTMNTDLYPMLNNALRNENWVKVDRLLPYAFCLCKSFFNLKLQANLTQEIGILNSQTPTSIFVYRGTAFDELALSFYDLGKLKYFSWNSVTSASKNQKIAEEFMYRNADIPKKQYPVMFVIEIPFTTEFESEYSKWIDIHQYSAIPTEDEVVLPPGSAFELIEVLTDQDNKTIIQVKLKNEIESLAHGGMMMQGALQSQMTEKEVKVMCLEGEELNQALMSLRGNKLIEELEFCLCKFDKKLLRDLFEILPTLEKAKKLKFITCVSTNPGEIIEISKETERCNIIKIEVTEENEFFQMICNKVYSQKYWISLKELDLDFRIKRSISDEELNRQVSQGLQYIPQLTHLNLNFEWCQQITDKGVNTLAQQLISLNQLTHLNMSFEWSDKITDEGLSFIATGLKYLPQLASLNLNFGRCVKITDKGVENIATGLKYLLQLTSLNLNFGRCSQIKGNGVKSFAKVLTSLTQLINLDLDFQKRYLITDQVLTSFPWKGLKHLTQLTTLTLQFYDCNITSKGMISFCSKGLGNLPQLTSLTLVGLQNDDKGLSIFASEGLKKLIQLTSLTLYICCRKDTNKKITDEGLSIFAFQGLKFLTSLIWLDLHFEGFGQITNQGVENLACEGLKNLIQLEVLILDFCNCDQITDEGIRILMSEGLQNLNQLIYLNLDFTDCMNITNAEIKTLASQFLKHLFPLKCLKIRDQKLESVSSTEDRDSQRISRVRFARESSNSPNFEMANHPSEQSDISEQSDLSEQSDFSEESSNQNLVEMMISSFKINPDGNHDPQSTPESLEVLSEVSRLTSLTLEFSSFESNITDQFVHNFATQVLRYSPQLKSLTLTFNKYNQITDKGVSDLASSGLKHLTALISLSLDFFNCNQIADEGISDLAVYGLKHLTGLESLKLSFWSCERLTDRALIDVTWKGLIYLSQLKCLTLGFAGCDMITNDGFMNLICNGLRELSQLECLILDRWSQITDEWIDAFVSRGLQSLTQLKSLTLNLSFSKITDLGVNNLILQLIKKLPKLTFLDLNLFEVDNVSDFALRNIIKVLHYFGFTNQVD